MNVLRQSVGKAEAEWQEEEPLRWEMRETLGEGKRTTQTKFPFDLTPLLAGYSRAFLLALRAYLFNRRLRAALKTVDTEFDNIRGALQISQNHFAKVCRQEGLAPVVFERIDSNLLLGLSAIKHKVPSGYLQALRALYRRARDNSALFSPDLHLGDFPSAYGDGDTLFSRMRKNVLASALSRSMLVQILNVTETAFETSALDLGRYALSRLMLSRAARPESYRVLLCKDLRVDTSGGVKKYFLTLTIPKARSATRPHATVAIHAEVGRLLEKQREAVVRRLGYLVQAKNDALSKEGAGAPRYTIGDLPLFPVLGNGAVGEPSTPRRRKGLIELLGMFSCSTSFIRGYITPLKALTGRQIGCTALRHTIATQLAIAGCSAGTIAAVLLHASDRTAQVYVDLIFEGAIDELSDSIEGTFSDHFPVFKEFVSANDVIDLERRVVSHSADRLRHETTGACGRRRICEYAPLSCYDCHRFKPAYDVDHAINLDLVTEEIDAAERGGLQRQNDVKRYTHIRNRIRVVITGCELKRAAIEVERSSGGVTR